MERKEKVNDNWITEILEKALSLWTEKLNEIWKLLTESPEEFRGGSIWNVIVNINSAISGIALALLVIFFLVGMVKTCGSFAEVKRPEVAVKLFIRFIIAKSVITYGLELMMMLFSVVQGLLATIMRTAGFNTKNVALPNEIKTAIDDLGLIASIPLWAVSLIICLIVWVLSFIIILTVYARFFKIYIYTAIAPVPLATFAGEPTQSIGYSFLKSYSGVLLEGAVIALACIVFSLFAQAPPIVDSSASVTSQLWSYAGELIFSMLVLVGTVKMANSMIKEIMGL